MSVALYKKFQKFAEKLVIEAGNHLKKNQIKVQVVKHKQSEDILTNLDLESQELIVDKIKKSFPEHGIVAEENDLKNINDFTWTVDPLDGTKYYAKGLPIYAATVSLFHKGKPVVGAIYYPVEGSLYSGSVGNGAFFNHRKVNLSQNKSLEKSMIYATLPNIGMSDTKFNKTLIGVTKLFKTCYRVRYLADSNVAMAWIAQGSFEAYINIPGDQPPWDVGGGMGILASAGGKITDLNGKPIKNFNFNQGLIASNGKIHQQLLNIINT